jgi:hypothetical protein
LFIPSIYGDLGNGLLLFCPHYTTLENDDDTHQVGPPFFLRQTQANKTHCQINRAQRAGDPNMDPHATLEVIGDHHSKLSIVENRKYRGFPSHGGTPKSVDFPL